MQHVCSLAAPNLDYASRVSIYFIDKCPLKCIGHDAYLMHDLPFFPFHIYNEVFGALTVMCVRAASVAISLSLFHFSVFSFWGQ